MLLAFFSILVETLVHVGPAFVTYSLLGMYPVVCDVLDSDFALLERAG